MSMTSKTWIYCLQQRVPGQVRTILQGREDLLMNKAFLLW